MTSKRPSFTWIQYQSPKKGFLTIFTVVGSFTLAWIPHGIKIAFQAVTLEQKLPIWFQLCSYWFLVSSFALHPFVYGLMNRAIRSEIFPAIFPPKNPALKGLPRKNSMRRISMPGKASPRVLPIRLWFNKFELDIQNCSDNSGFWELLVLCVWVVRAIHSFFTAFGSDSPNRISRKRVGALPWTMSTPEFKQTTVLPKHTTDQSKFVSDLCGVTDWWRSLTRGTSFMKEGKIML